MGRFEWLFGKSPQDSPEFVRVVEQYAPSFEQFRTPEQARENFRRAFELFKSVCDRVNVNNVDEALARMAKESHCVIEGPYNPKDPAVQGMVLRARLVVPHFDELALGTRDCIPTLADADNNPAANRRTLQHLIAQFIKQGIAVKW